MKIVILMGSPNENGSTAMLCSEFSRGAEEAGHEIEQFNVANMNIAPWRPEKTEDDFNIVCAELEKADMVVLATPIYYFDMSAQLKAVIDRFSDANHDIKHSGPNGEGLKSALLCVSHQDKAEVMDTIKLHYRKICEYLNWHDQGAVLGTGCGSPEITKSSPKLAEAYSLGKSLGIDK